jgi:hypothetical protein
MKLFERFALSFESGLALFIPLLHLFRDLLALSPHSIQVRLAFFVEGFSLYAETLCEIRGDKRGCRRVSVRKFLRR